MKKLFSLLFISICFLSPHFSKAQGPSEPEKNFETLWSAFDSRYAIFLPKRIDWHVLYGVYRPKVTPQTSDDELFEIMSNMLGHLNDNHVRLTTTNQEKIFVAGILNKIYQEQFSDMEAAIRFMRQRPVSEQYIKGEYKERLNGIFAFGWVADDIGYFHLRGFSNVPESSKIIDEIIREFKDAKAIIIDVRRNGGGDDKVGKAIADRFADRKRLYMITQVREGKEYDDFSQTEYWYTEPEGPVQFTKPVVLLTSRTSISAAENFALAMRVLPQATIVGDFTSGCFADVYGDSLPNGWKYFVSYKLFVDQDGFCWEGIGVPPDLMMVNSKEDMEKRKDRVLEFVIDLINTGALKPKLKTYKYPIKQFPG
jgi:carboxyl-terminal processing protease